MRGLRGDRQPVLVLGEPVAVPVDDGREGGLAGRHRRGAASPAGFMSRVGNRSGRMNSGAGRASCSSA
ncbi:hypothetical protein J2Z21_005126 [Streptomyces griseochromogenes]|uniref:Uncharacterized protein n=1 Tax=Streptomyces griseochromogenes TaxID=68214 RepID=A0ABS4LY56_9ACTN|nr:hypothetical protein [Streptomyces griseochromogenes]